MAQSGQQSKPRYVVPGTVQTPGTLSTVQLYAMIRTAMLDYVSPQDERLVDFVGAPARVYVRASPEPPVFPYLTLLLSRTSQASYNGYREEATLEVQAIGKPESQLPLVESAMDLVDQCLTSYTQAGDGLVVGRSRTRSTVPLFTSPAESATVGVVASYTLYLWPAVLTSRRT
jgi:hypothetical protein